MMMDFKKAFDSLEWVYIMNILAEEKRQQKRVEKEKAQGQKSNV